MSSRRCAGFGTASAIWLGMSLCSLLLSCEEAKAPRSSSKDASRAKDEAVSDLPPTVNRQKRASSERVLSVATRKANYAITKLQLERAAELLEDEVGAFAALARARLAVYSADCEAAEGHLASEATRALREAQELIDLAPRCARATHGGIIVSDEQKGIWLRLQDDADRVLVPLIVEVAVQARSTLEKDLDETLPRPLRIDLVRDLFSLSAVSGLPLEAAETTGTVAVARWGRVTMVSPRAMQRGFPWADTLAHEITHLLISRATADRAPLWLQEGVAKREEQRWRPAHAFDDEEDFSERAYQAQVSGSAIGIDRLGPSIAMLPSADDASIAFAEVTSFIGFWIEKNGPHSLGLLLRDLEVSKSDDGALRSVSGYGVADWQLLWRRELSRRFASAPLSIESSDPAEPLHRRTLAQNLRMMELLTTDGEFMAASDYAAAHWDQATHVAAYRFLATRAALLGDSGFAESALGGLEDVEGVDAGWLSLLANRKAGQQSSEEAQRLFSHAIALDPLLPEVACGGAPWVGERLTPGHMEASRSPFAIDPELCAHTRTLVVRGSR